MCGIEGNSEQLETLLTFLDLKHVALQMAQDSYGGLQENKYDMQCHDVEYDS